MLNVWFPYIWYFPPHEVSKSLNGFNNWDINYTYHDFYLVDAYLLLQWKTRYTGMKAAMFSINDIKCHRPGLLVYLQGTFSPSPTNVCAKMKSNNSQPLMW